MDSIVVQELDISPILNQMDTINSNQQIISENIFNIIEVLKYSFIFIGFISSLLLVGIFAKGWIKNA